jgi:hypothetical protein
MIKIELTPDGYERIADKIQAVTNAINKGIFNQNEAGRHLQEAACGLYELRQTLNDVCLLTPDNAGPQGPNAA